jgi:DNA (cytosine-5)-methyltransferase 1
VQMFTLPKDKPSLLDTFCKAGGCARGYQRAGFYVVGVDVEPQPKYVGDEFYQADAIEFIKEHGHLFDVIHASPVCKGYSKLASLNPDADYPDQIAEVRYTLKASGKSYVIENVEGAPLQNYVMLCGTMFDGLRVIRHRLFECNPPILFSPRTCNHWGTVSGNAAWNEEGRVTPSLDLYDFLTVTGNDYIAADGRKAMQIDWMTKKELSQAIPPAYTEWLGGQLINALKTQGSLTLHAADKENGSAKNDLFSTGNNPVSSDSTSPAPCG